MVYNDSTNFADYDLYIIQDLIIQVNIVQVANVQVQSWLQYCYAAVNRELHCVRADWSITRTANLV